MRVALFLAVVLMAVLVLGCNDDDTAVADPARVPTPAGAVIRQSCETIAATDYFLNEDERVWFRENCNRLDCNVIRGTQYVSTAEREWYLRNCP